MVEQFVETIADSCNVTLAARTKRAISASMAAWLERGTGLELAYRDGAWSSGSTRATEVIVGGLKVVGVRQPAIADAEGGTVVDAQARAIIANILASLRGHGLIAS